MPFAVAAWIASRALLLLAAVATSSVSFVIVVAGFYVIASCAGPAYSSLMKEIYPDSARARIMGYARVCTLGVYIGVTSVAGMLLHAVTYRIIFPLAGLFGIASALVFNRITADETAGKRGVSVGRFVHDTALILRQDKPFRWLCGSIFVFGFGNFFAQPVYAVYQVDVLGVDTRWASVYQVASALAALLAYARWGSYIDKMTPPRVVPIVMLAWLAVPLTYLVATHAWMLVGMSVIAGFASAGMELSYLNSVLHYAARERISQYQSLFAGLMGIRGCIAPFIGASLVESGVLSYGAVFAISALFALSGSLIQFISNKRQRYVPSST